MTDKEILNYLQEGVKRGFSVQLLKQKLIEGGFAEKDINEALLEMSGIKQQNFSTKQLPTANRPVEEKRLGIFGKIGKSFAHPRELFEKTSEESFGKAFGYLFVILLVPLILGNILIYFFIESLKNKFPEYAGYVSSSVYHSLGIYSGFTLIGIPILIFLWTIILHLIIKIYGGSGNFVGTFRSLVYSSTPKFILFFIPLVGIWSFIVSLIGLSVNHKFPKWKVFLSYVTMGLIALIIYLLVYLMRMV